MEPKPVKESIITISHLMQPEHANPGGIVHGGVVMKEIDNAAGVVAIRHCKKPAVTASIDRIDFYNMVFVGNLVTFKASVNNAWNSSMEIGVRVEAEDLLTGEIRHVASAYLTFVAVSEEGKPVNVPKVNPVTDDEKRRANEAEARKKVRLEMKKAEKKCQVNPEQCNI
jgi:acyl-CoA hydrolase